MNKPDLIDALAKKNGISFKRAEEAINIVFNTMFSALSKGDKIEIRGFGSITIREYQQRTGRNPKTGELIDVKPKKSPFFKAGKDLKEKIAKS